MFRDMSSRTDDVHKAPSSRGSRKQESTQSRIFGMSCEELDKIKEDKKRFLAKKIEVGGQPKDLEVADELPHAAEKAELEQPEKVTELDNNAHGVRYSSFMDENISNQNKIRDQKMQQKQWLDQQIAERKSMDRKSKQSDHMMQKSITNRDAISTSENNQMFIKKREEQQEIQDYNENAAKQKRQKEKQLKEDDIKEEVDRQHMEDEKEDQLQKERALTREKRLNHQN